MLSPPSGRPHGHPCDLLLKVTSQWDRLNIAYISYISTHTVTKHPYSVPSYHHNNNYYWYNSCTTKKGNEYPHESKSTLSVILRPLRRIHKTWQENEWLYHQHSHSGDRRPETDRRGHQQTELNLWADPKIRNPFRLHPLWDGTFFPVPAFWIPKWKHRG